MQTPTMGGAGNLGSASGVHLSGLGTTTLAFGATTAPSIQPPPTTWGDAGAGGGVVASAGVDASQIAGVNQTQSTAHIAAAQAAAAAAAVASSSLAGSGAGAVSGGAVGAGGSSRPGSVGVGLGASASMYHGIGQGGGGGIGVSVGGVGVANGTTNASDEEAYRAAQMKRRKQLLDIQVEESRSQWVHPAVGQEETIIFHRVRALISLTGLSQIFICRLTGVTPASLSQYLRCNFKGRQDLLEDKLEIFIHEYLEGKYDGNARRVQPGRRAIVRRPDQQNTVLQNAATAHHHALMQRQVQAQAQAQAHAHVQSYTQPQVQVQAQRYGSGHNRAPSHSVPHNQYQQHGMYARYTQTQPQQHLTAQQQQYMQHEYLLRQQQQQQAHLYHQQVLARQQQQARVAAATAAAKVTAPPMKPLPPTVAVERAYHAYHSAVLDITSTNAEPLLVPIEIDVSVSEEEAKLVEAELKVAEKRTQTEAPAQTQTQGNRGNEKRGESGKESEKTRAEQNENNAMDIDTRGKEGEEESGEKDRTGQGTDENNGGGGAGDRKGSLDSLMNALSGEEMTAAEKSNDAGNESGSVEGNETRKDVSRNDSKPGVEGDTVAKEELVKFVEGESNGTEGMKDLVNELLKAATGEETASKNTAVENTDAEKEKTQNTQHAEESKIGNSTSMSVDGTKDREGDAGETTESKDRDEVMEVDSEKKDGDKTEGQTEKEVRIVVEGGKVDGDGDLEMEDVNKSWNSKERSEDEGGTRANEVEEGSKARKEGRTEKGKNVEASKDVSGDEQKASTLDEGNNEISGLSRHLKYYTQWDVNERQLSPEEVAEGIIRTRKVHPALKKSVTMTIRRQLFEAGVACAVPPSLRDRENRRRIAIRVRLIEDDDQFLEDSFDWDICMGELNSPELLAQYLCSDHGVSQYHVPQVASAIRRKVAIAQAIAYGDAETRSAALKCVPPEDPLIEQLPALRTGVRKLTKQEVRNMAEKRVRTNVVDHVLRLVDREAKRREAKREVEEKQRQLEVEERRRREKQEKAARQAKEAEIKKIEKKLSMLTDRVCDRIGVESIPYTLLKLARGVSPSVWAQGLLLRKKDGKNPLPFCDPTPAEVSEPDKRSSRRRSNTASASAPPSTSASASASASDDNNTTATTGTTATPRKRNGRRGRPAKDNSTAADGTTPSNTRKRRASSRSGASTKRARK